ncbi:hypothetical protein B0T18DRAFT_419312 [Schizothecium vesticola]|uniref:Uncharacterized protein n=1 Tax=Schizothecium vesticola TaxID=314040 RepID=A0AA40K005_9PEZI|nr:hypothetical protein B0T18DRAFT_419312 [Schizothecium vesticola]
MPVATALYIGRFAKAVLFWTVLLCAYESRRLRWHYWLLFLLLGLFTGWDASQRTSRCLAAINTAESKYFPSVHITYSLALGGFDWGG